jgi:hypothetical protein
MEMKIYRQIDTLTNAEKEAAQAYRSESGFFHLAAQADHSMALAEFEDYGRFALSGKPLALKAATSSRYELTTDVTLYSGHGSGTGVLGALGHSDVARFKGMTWRYRGFTSASPVKEIAEKFVWTRAKSAGDVPVLLEFRLAAGFRLLPMQVLGSDFEVEFLLPSNVPFTIIEASRVTIGDVSNVLHLVLKPA